MVSRSELFCVVLFVFVNFFEHNEAFLNTANQNIQMFGRWCCLNQNEYNKCNEWRIAANQSNISNGTVILECVLATDKFDCFRKIFEDKADLMSADAGEVYTAGKYYNLLPISTETYTGGPSQPTHSEHYTVAVVKRGSGMTMGKLKGANSCHGGVGTSSGWNIPISTLIEKQMLEIVDCNNHVKAATKFFNKMCAPDALNTQFNPTGDNPTSACQLCRGKIGSTFCTNQDPYAGSIGAMYCLIDGGGDVAFVKHTTVNELVSLNRSTNANDFELLCPNVYGSPYNSPGNVTIYPYPTAPLADYKLCNWGIVPGRAILTSSRKALVQRRSYRKFLVESAQRFGGQQPFFSSLSSSTTNQPPLFNNLFNNNFNTNNNMSLFNSNPNFPSQQNNNNPNFLLQQQANSTMAPFGQNVFEQFTPSRFYLFDSKSYNGRDLLFLDQTVAFQDLDDKITYLSFLPEVYRNKILKLYECPLRLVRWCVISSFEKDKCRQMKNAFASRNIKPDLDCVSADSAWECMSMIKNRMADLITLDPADAYRASRYFNLQPLAAEDYGTMTEMPIYYAVAVVKRTDLTTNLWNLRTKRACGTAIGDMAGWHVPVNYLIAIKELYVTNCHVPKVAGEYFGRSCIPGAMDYDYNTLRTNPRSLCLRCYSKGADYCARSQHEMFYGDAGAFRCLDEGLGDVAFVRHTAVAHNTDGRNTAQWARPLRQTDYELICKDGTRRSVEKYEECNLAKVPAKLIMTGGHRTEIQRSYLWNMLNFAQQLFGSDT